jgi:hypothetical protein
LSPVTWNHYFLLLVLPVIQLWRAFPEPRWERIVLIMALVPMCLSPLVFVRAFGGTATFVSLIGVSVQFFALTALFLLGLVPHPKDAERPSPKISAFAARPVTSISVKRWRGARLARLDVRVARFHSIVVRRLILHTR